MCKYPELEDRDWLKQYYHDQAMTLRQIATLLGCAMGTVSKAVTRHELNIGPGGPGRTRPNATTGKPRPMGTRYGMLKLYDLGSQPGMFLVHCDCHPDRYFEVKGSNLSSGATRSCGCQEGNRTHGATTSRPPIYNRWTKLNGRCFCETDKDYHHYGGRGITVCEGWRGSNPNGFVNFYRDMGDPPPGKSIDRIDNDGHYSCGHCDECVSKGWPANLRWATQSEQIRNQRRHQKPTSTDD